MIEIENSLFNYSKKNQRYVFDFIQKKNEKFLCIFGKRKDIAVIFIRVVSVSTKTINARTSLLSQRVV